MGRTLTEVNPFFKTVHRLSQAPEVIAYSKKALVNELFALSSKCQKSKSFVAGSAVGFKDAKFFFPALQAAVELIDEFEGWRLLMISYEKAKVLAGGLERSDLDFALSKMLGVPDSVGPKHVRGFLLFIEVEPGRCLILFSHEKLPRFSALVIANTVTVEADKVFKEAARALAAKLAHTLHNSQIMRDRDSSYAWQQTADTSDLVEMHWIPSVKLPQGDAIPLQMVLMTYIVAVTETHGEHLKVKNSFGSIWRYGMQLEVPCLQARVLLSRMAGQRDRADHTGIQKRFYTAFGAMGIDTPHSDGTHQKAVKMSPPGKSCSNACRAHVFYFSFLPDAQTELKALVDEATCGYTMEDINVAQPALTDQGFAAVWAIMSLGAEELL